MARTCPQPNASEGLEPGPQRSRERSLTRGYFETLMGGGGEAEAVRTQPSGCGRAAQGTGGTAVKLPAFQASANGIAPWGCAIKAGMFTYGVGFCFLLFFPP